MESRDVSQFRPRDVLAVALPMDGLALTVECSVPKVDWQKEHWVGSSTGSG